MSDRLVFGASVVLGIGLSRLPDWVGIAVVLAGLAIVAWMVLASIRRRRRSKRLAATLVYNTQLRRARRKDDGE